MLCLLLSLAVDVVSLVCLLLFKEFRVSKWREHYIFTSNLLPRRRLESRYGFYDDSFASFYSHLLCIFLIVLDFHSYHCISVLFQAFQLFSIVEHVFSYLQAVMELSGFF